MKAKLIVSAIYLGIYGLYYGAVYFGPKIAKKVVSNRIKKEEHMRRMDEEAIEVEWRFA